MNRCTKCNRPLKRTSPHGMGPVCARAAFGLKPGRVQPKQRPADTRQQELALEVVHG